MKKRVLAMLMALTLTFTLLPVSAMAEEPETPEDPAVCTCTVKCVEGTVHADCPVCSLEGADLTACVGEEDETPVCTCGAEDDVHAEDCALYVAPIPAVCDGTDECAAESHEEGCPKYVAPIPAVCDGTDECAAETHAEGCPKYVAPVPTAAELLQARIDALPAEDELAVMDETERDEVFAEVEAIYDALFELTDEELETIDQTALEEAATALTQDVMTLPEVPAAGVYVSAEGSDETGDGTYKKPYATLAKAVEEAKDGDTIYVMSNVTMNASARYLNKKLTVTSGEGGPYTVTRGTIPAVQDPARGGYNPAMIEVGGTEYQLESSLTLEDIILDDAGIKVGSYFVQADSEGDGNTTVDKKVISNTDIVQDAMVATYNGTATITLGDGAVLRNFAGMSAVRLSGGVLTMEEGSTIEDTTVTDRIKGETGSFGPAGAIWMQGGNFTMEDGAEIRNVIGRAVYVDGGTASIDGTISNIAGDTDIWYGYSGVAIHIRNNGSAVLGSTGKIDTITGEHASYRGAVMTNGRADGEYGFEAKQGSVISNVTGFPTLYSNYGTELLNGTIENCTNDFIIGGFAQNTTIGETGVIRNCDATKGAARAIVYTSNACKVFMNGTMKENDASHAFYIINQSGGGASLTMNEGALVSGKGSGDGVYINASESSFTMNGGVIENFSNGVYCREKDGRLARFNMNGGTIRDNKSYGVYFTMNGSKTNSPSWAVVDGGSITNNGTSYQMSATSGYACDTSDYLKLTAGVADVPTVNTSFGTLTLDADYRTVYLGTAAHADVKTAMAAKATALDGSHIWTAKGTPLYIKATEDGDYHFNAVRSYSVDKDTELYVGFIPIDADGVPVADGNLVLIKMPYNATNLSITLPALVANQAYAVAYLNSEVPVKQYTVKLDMDGGLFGLPFMNEEPRFTQLTNLVVNEGDYVSAYYWTQENYIPRKDGFNFGGWYEILADGSLAETAWTQNDPVMHDMTLKARWTTDCIVTFDPNGGTLAAGTENPVTVQSGNPVAKPADPTYDGYLFINWYQVLADGTLADTPFDFTTPIEEDITLRAQWVEQHTVKFDSNGGTPTYSDQTVVDGGKATDPGTPSKSGYDFQGWYNGDKLWNFDTDKVSGDMTLTAKWVKKSTGGGSSDGSSGGGSKLNTEDHYSYLAGYQDGTLKPYDAITRGQVATIFFRLLTDEAREEYWCTTNDYTDVPADLWCNNAISTLSNMGIIDGYQDGSFKPYGKITRAQFAKMAVGFFETTAREYEGYFEDVPEDAWFTSYVEAAARVGLVGGFEDGTFRPNTNITRAQACVIVNRALDRKPDEEHLLPERKMIMWPDIDEDDWFYADMMEATNSHDYHIITERIDGEKVELEEWTKKLPQRDWAAFENMWADANAAPFDGEVVKD